MRYRYTFLVRLSSFSAQSHESTLSTTITTSSDQLHPEHLSSILYVLMTCYQCDVDTCSRATLFHVIKSAALCSTASHSPRLLTASLVCGSWWSLSYVPPTSAVNSTHDPFYCAISIECLLRRTFDSLEKRVAPRSQGHFAAASKRRTRGSHHSKSWEFWDTLLLEVMGLGHPPMAHRNLN
jgi:hypothetical protein